MGMTLKEITDFRLLEIKGGLRNPKSLSGLSKEERIKREDLIEAINYQVIDSFEGLTSGYLVPELCIIKNPLVKSFDKIEQNKAFLLKTELGEGMFCNAHYCFDNCEYPKGVEQNACFNNAFITALQLAANSKQCEIVSGIAYLNGSFLHSVVKIGDYILDFNLNLYISAELYFKLLNFEVLATLDGKVAYEDYKYMGDEMRKNDKYLQTWHRVFAYEDYVDILLNKNRKSEQKRYFIMDV